MAEPITQEKKETTSAPHGVASKDGAAGARPVWFKKAARGFLAVVLVIVLALGIRYAVYMRSHASTDDAYITSDIIQISPQVSGTVTHVYVQDNQPVKKGDLLITLDDLTYRAAVDQAKANLTAAIAQDEGAGVSVQLAQQTGAAQITQAQGGVGQAQSGIAGARASVAQAQAGIESSVAGLNRAQAQVKTAQAAVATAKAQVSATRAAVVSAQATYDNAAREAKRHATLAEQGAESQQIADQTASAATSARAGLDSAKEQVKAAEAVVNAREADLASSRQQVNASQAGIRQSQAQLVSAQQTVTGAVSKQEQAEGQLTQAQTAPTQVALSKNQKQQALAKVEQARAALDNAMLQLSYTKIYAPVDGRVSKKNVEVGELLQPGTPLMALIPPANLWVVANYKETQMSGISKGCSAEVDVDAIPGQIFKGHVDSIAAGTGATFALLPPENATGNFVKVVQRIPVKIVIDRGQPNLDQLAAGMSVTAIIKTK